LLEVKEREDIPEPEDGVTYPKMLDRCTECMHLKLRLFHDKEPTLDSDVSWLVANEHVQEMYCEMGRIRFRNGKEKSYKSKHSLVLMREGSDLDADCPDYEPDEPFEEDV